MWRLNRHCENLCMLLMKRLWSAIIRYVGFMCMCRFFTVNINGIELCHLLYLSNLSDSVWCRTVHFGSF